MIDAITERIANDMRGVALPLNLWWPDWGSLAEHAQMPVSFSPVRLTISDAAIARLEAAIEGMRAKGLVVESLTQ